MSWNKPEEMKEDYGPEGEANFAAVASHLNYDDWTFILS
jgi:hypothetical protein